MPIRRAASPVLAALCLCTPALAADAPADVRWDMEGLARIVRPMHHSMQGRLPLILWNFPIPRGDQLARLRDDGTLRKHIDLMAERGIIPTVEMGWEWNLAGALAMARTLQEAGRPVHVLIPQPELIEKGVYEHCTAWGEGPDATRKGQSRKWPCLPLADGRAGADHVRKALLPYKEAGIELAAAWFDDEALPHPWNGCFEAQRKSPECRKHYPPGILDDFTAFNQYVYTLRSRLLVEVMVHPVRELFPKALVGNYGEFASSKEVPFEGRRPPRTLDPRLPLMPSAYANTNYLPRYFKPDEAVTQEKADPIHFHALLHTVSTCNANKQPGQLSIPYLSRYVPDNPDPRFLFGLSQRLFRELVRHVWLRGADTIYIFNLGYPTRPQLVTPAFSFESVEDVRSVYDELLAHRDFLDKGEPMNFGVPKLGSAEPVWSGLRLGDRCLVRAFTLGAAPAKVSVPAFPGVAVALDAPPEGATYLVGRDGRVEALAADLSPGSPR